MTQTADTHTTAESAGQDYLLNDDQIVDFIVQGYMLVQTDFPPEFHQSICDQIDQVFDQVGNPGDEILERVPDLYQIYDDPRVKGALASILGSDYAMHSHRHCHFTGPGHPGGHWHQDSLNQRHHQIRTVLAMYYPQTVTEEMGPTLVLPGTQYHNTPSTRMGSYMNFKSQVAMVVPAGAVAITHYDLWHAWMPNRSRQNRRMLKFLFSRASEPVAPSWHHNSAFNFGPRPFTLPIDGQSDAYKHRLIWRYVWDWLKGKNPDPDTTTW